MLQGSNSCKFVAAKSDLVVQIFWTRSTISHKRQEGHLHSESTSFSDSEWPLLSKGARNQHFWSTDLSNHVLIKDYLSTFSSKYFPWDFRTPAAISQGLLHCSHKRETLHSWLFFCIWTYVSCWTIFISIVKGYSQYQNSKRNFRDI